MERIAFRSGRLEVLGRLGEWQTTTVIEPSDVVVLLRKTGVPLMLVSALLAVTRCRRRV